jgi:gamma-glutamyltranspeptidase/glutathione hydrolase
MVMGSEAVVSAGHYLATEVGMQILRGGGNAFDAAVATGFALSVLKPHQNGIAGEVPMLVYSAADQKTLAISGAGVAPRAATLEAYRSLGIEVIPGDGFLPTTVPSAFATYVLVFEQFGTLRLSDVLTPAVTLARRGFPMYDALRNSIAEQADRFREEWPSSAEKFLVDDEIPANVAPWRQPTWAATFEAAVAQDQQYGDRRDGCHAALDYFYRGPVAERIAAFCAGESVLDASGDRHRGLLTVEDLAGFSARVEEPVSTVWQDMTVYKCGPWTQGPVFLQSLNLLKPFDLTASGHNSADYIHTVTECMKLAFADREYYYGDPAFSDIPLDRLLSEAYALERAALVDLNAASMQLRPGGYPPITAQRVTDVESSFAKGDTTKFDVIDCEGNMVSGTPSGGWLMGSPVVPGLGFPLGTRGQMFSLLEGHPNCIAPGKRPRQTLTPTLVTREGRPCMVFGSPGGDVQDQWALQFFLNVTVHGMSLQEAVEAPTFWTEHFPNSFYPRHAVPGSLFVESRVPAQVRKALAERGHQVTMTAAWSGGNTLAAGIDHETGTRYAAASPRLNPAAAAAW